MKEESIIIMDVLKRNNIEDDEEKNMRKTEEKNT